MDISVIIPTHNNASVLNRTLSNLCCLSQQADMNWELLIVNNNCTDDTDDIVKLYEGKLPIKLMHELQLGTSVAKNTGINNSSGKLVVFTDDDVRPVPEWLEIYWKNYCIMPEVFFWGGPVISNFESSEPDLRLMQYAPPSVAGLDFGNHQMEIPETRFFIGANWACTRKALDAVGYFDVDMGLNPSGKNIKVGEETDLMERLRRMGYVGIYLPEALIFHFVPAFKTTLKHIASRGEAHAYYTALKIFSDSNLTRVPAWAFRLFIESWVVWRFKRWMGNDAIDEYMAYKKAVGKMRAAVECVCSGFIK